MNLKFNQEEPYSRYQACKFYSSFSSAINILFAKSLMAKEDQMRIRGFGTVGGYYDTTTPDALLRVSAREHNILIKLSSFYETNTGLISEIPASLNRFLLVQSNALMLTSVPVCISQ